MHVANLSLSSKAEAMFGPLHEVADQAYFSGTVLVCAANNLPGPTYPSQYASVISVASRAGSDDLALAYNPHPPVEFGARGIDVDVAWADRGSITATGNSFAAPHVTAMVALMRSKHPWLTPLQVKAVLHAASDNSVPGPDASRDGIVTCVRTPTDRSRRRGRVALTKAGPAGTPPGGSDERAGQRVRRRGAPRPHRSTAPRTPRTPKATATSSWRSEDVEGHPPRARTRTSRLTCSRRGTPTWATARD